ncbi:heat shock factor-binding protein 1 [Prunus yedoensis var. nudiflora]|uniref:Heat shock factor-binding protein 1 n=1 Tax=Prunus yedoensis var. nudiflora TaxID=2094558 RepID=A0A314ZBN6_PRUYE|nr:heat shock factor-binding protein 1 [Prunus yedoensis var. nudiflora]
MGTRINDLEHSINDLRTEMGIEGSPSPVQQPKPEAGEVKEQEASSPVSRLICYQNCLKRSPIHTAALDGVDSGSN